MRNKSPHVESRRFGVRRIGWHPKQTPNPAIQTHYRVLEMCALERNVMEPVNDDTEPALDEWQKVGVPALLADYDEKCFGRARAIDDHHGRAQPIDTAAKRPRTSDDTPRTNARVVPIQSPPCFHRTPTLLQVPCRLGQIPRR